VDLSGIIFVVLALAWAVYLIPKALKHHDEVARTRSIDRFSTAMRVLARREPVSRRGSSSARLVVTPARAADNPRVLAPAPLSAEERTTDRPASRPAVRPAVRRAAARAAARRRRSILSFLVLATLVVTGLAAFAVVPWWSVAVPAVLTVLYLVLCRTQVRRERDATWDADLAASIDALPVARVEARSSEPARPAARVDAPYGAPRTAVRNAQGFEEVDAEEDTVAIEVALLDAVVVPTVDGGSLWDPLPVTLPTYVTKPKARRTVRTIDLDEPGTWSSGRSSEDTELVAQTAAAEAEQATGEDEAVEPQRAVGS
jgi:hypothetical protein